MKEKTEVTIMCDEFITQSELDSRMRDANTDSIDEFMERIDCVYMTGATRSGVDGYALFFWPTMSGAMMYPFITLDDDTEIVHSEMREDGTVKVYMEKPVEGGFHSAVWILPKYEWSGIEGYSDREIERYADVIRSAAHLIIKYAQRGGYANAANF